MLGKPAKGLRELKSHFGKRKFTLEFKYDGERAQIHVLADGTIKIFSRGLEDHSAKYPDLMPVIRAALAPQTDQSPPNPTLHASGTSSNTDTTASGTAASATTASGTTGDTGTTATKARSAARGDKKDDRAADLKTNADPSPIESGFFSATGVISAKSAGVTAKGAAASQGGTACILDCEIVAWDAVKGTILPFQELSHRRRKTVKAEDVTVQVCVFAFDMLYRDGKSLLKMPLAKRRAQLKTLNLNPGKFHLAESIDSCEEGEMAAFMASALRGRCEGVMAKALYEGAEYVPDARTWLKLKKDYMDGVGDTLDLVPIGAFLGKGKRGGSYGAYLLACYDEKADEYQSICKVGTGFSDADLKALSFDLQPHVVAAPPENYRYGKAPDMACDVWFAPALVFEVLCADISLSPAHMAALSVLAPNKGISIRFPRFLRLRSDKRPREATSAAQCVDLYRNQTGISAKAQPLRSNSKASIFRLPKNTITKNTITIEPATKGVPPPGPNSGPLQAPNAVEPLLPKAIALSIALSTHKAISPPPAHKSVVPISAKPTARILTHQTPPARRP